MRDEYVGLASTWATIGLARACSRPVWLSTWLAVPLAPASVEATWAASVRQSLAGPCIDAGIPAWWCCLLVIVWLAPMFVCADDEAVSAPVLAASATPPVTQTASPAAIALAVRSFASGDLIICPLRGMVTGLR